MNTPNTLPQLIAQALLDDNPVKTFAVEDVPRSIDDAYVMQRAMIEQLNRNICGWKIAATNTTGQQHIGVTHPLAGRLFTETTFFSGESVAFANNKMAVAEAEFAFVIGDALPPRTTEYSEAEVKDAVEALYPAIELPDSRLENFASAGAPVLIVDNACAREFVLGDAAADNWREIDLADARADVLINSKNTVTGFGRDVLSHPLAALTWLINHASKTGEGITAGEIITTGVLGKPVPIAQGDTIEADFGTLGTVSVKLI